MVATCKLGTNGCWNDDKCRATSNCAEKVITNGDKISASPYEELTKLFDKIGYSCIYPDKECFEDDTCKACWAKYLQQSTEE